MNFRFFPLSLVLTIACSFSAVAEPKTSLQKGTLQLNPLPGEVTLQYLAAEGRVRKGEILAVFDCTAYAAKLREVEKTISAKESALKEIEEGLKQAQTESETAVAEAELDVSNAERALKRFVEGEGPISELALKLALHDAEAAAKQQAERFAVRDKLLEEGFIQKVEYNNEEVLLKRTQLTLEGAKLKLETFTKFDKEQLAAQHARTLETKKAALKKLQASIAAQEAASGAALKRGQDELLALGAEQKRWKEFLQKAVIRAAADGNFSPDERVERGSLIPSGQAIGVIRE